MPFTTKMETLFQLHSALKWIECDRQVYLTITNKTSFQLILREFSPTIILNHENISGH